MRELSNNEYWFGIDPPIDESMLTILSSKDISIEDINLGITYFGD